VSLFLDVRNVAGGDNTVAFELSKAVLKWAVTDENGKAVADTESTVPTLNDLLGQKVVLEAGAGRLLPLSQTDGESPGNRAGYLGLVPGRAWFFESRNNAHYYLSGTIETPFVAQGVWYGTLKLPRTEIPVN
jgi:hypothetical protein